MLTYEQRREILESALNKIIPQDEDSCCCCWVADLDDEYVYFINKNTSYRANYTIVELQDGSHEATIDMDTKIEVMRSWKEFEENCEEKLTVETEPVETEAVETVDDVTTEAEEVEESTEASTEEEDKEVEESIVEEEPTNVEHCDDDSNDDSNDNQEIEKSTVTEEAVDDKIDESVEATESVEIKEAEKVEENSDESTSENESVEVEDCKNIEENSEVDDSIEEETVENEPEEEITLSTVTYSVNGEDVNADTLYAKFTEIQEKYNALVNKVNEANNNMYATFAKELISNETELVADKAEEIYSIVEEDCKANKFSCKEDVQKFAEQLIASALYEQIKDARKHEKDLCISFNKEDISKHKALKNDSQALKEANDKLKRI